MITVLKDVEKQVKLSPLERVLLTTDGSITRILDAITGEEVKVKTVAQRLVKASRELAKELRIREGAEVNYRVVDIKSSKAALLHAISYAPIERLAEEFKEDIMKKDMPIGRIMASLNIESRREIKEFDVIKGDAELCRRFRLPAGTVFLKRRYHVIHGGEVLISITEIFPSGVF